jgi:hypothetical protein
LNNIDIDFIENKKLYPYAGDAFDLIRYKKLYPYAGDAFDLIRFTAGEGQLEILQWLYDVVYNNNCNDMSCWKFILFGALVAAAQNNRLSVVQWLFQRTQPDIERTRWIIDLVEPNSDESARWLRLQIGDEFDDES